MKEYNENCFKNKNYDPNFLSDAFLRTIAFGKSVAGFKGETAVMSIKCKDDILLAVKKAYIDMSPRTFIKNEEWWANPENTKADKKERKKKKEDDWQKEKNKVFEWLTGKFLDYIENGCKNFNDWHNKLCTEFLQKFTPVLNDYGYQGEESLKYGKAQKIVNMTFKYLYCFDDARENEEKFSKCHMPIDSYILKWYNGISNEKYNGTWSDMDEPTYKDVQKKISDVLKKYKPFLAEFYIWAEYNN